MLYSLLPILIYLLAIKAMDAFAFTTWRRLAYGVIAGAASCGAAFGITRLTEWQQVWCTPLLEEILKSIFVLYLIFNHRRTFHIAFFSEAIVYGMAVGAGFALIENTLYFAFSDDLSALECVIRGFGTALLHMGCTALVASCVLLATRLKTARTTLTMIGGTIGALSLSTAIHSTYNMFLLAPFIQLIITVLLFLVLFYLIYMAEERMIHSWLDLSITNDISLLAAIREGNLQHTAAGQYLISVRDSFHQEVFFDMCVYLQLYLEMSIQAKSRLIMREAEMDASPTPEEHQRNIDNLKELNTLKRNIGLVGLSVLKPFTYERDVDTWVLNELL